jgi:GTPase SAR1 family protein
MLNSNSACAAGNREMKLVLLGNASAGKTSVLQRVINDSFAYETPSTLSPTYLQKVVTIDT